MKCPKCEYLGFETGDRCRNCGYDFSLMGAPAAPQVDLPLREPDTVTGAPVGDLALLPAVRAPDESGAGIASSSRPRLVEPPLPLFTPDGVDDDTPLITLPAHPRPPLAVRRTPDPPARRSVNEGVSGLRAVAKPPRRASAHAVVKSHPEPVLAFGEDDPADRKHPAPEEPQVAAVTRAAQPAAPARINEPPRPALRLGAAAVDHLILLGIDASVLYFTLRLAEVADWSLLPIGPMMVFLGLVKAAYFCVFTLVGGQTIGKMAVRIRVVSEDGRGLDPARAIQRTLAAALSVVTLGVAFLPAVLSPDRRAFHDRLARTRVVGL